MAPVASDLDLSDDFPRHERGSCISRFLGSKGFCVLSSSHFFADDVVKQALSEAQEAAAPLIGSSVLQRPSSWIAEGMLGSYGSARVAMVTPGDEAPALGLHLQMLESCMVGIVEELQPDAWQFAGMLEGLSPCFLHETGAPTGADVPLSVQEVEYWAQTLTNQKLMCLHFLGPGTGSLELQPFDDEEAEALDVPTGPGITVLLRADLLLHRHRSMTASYVVSSFFLDPPRRQPGPVMHPVARDLNAYIETYLKELKDRASSDELSLHPSISREKQSAMNRALLQGDNTPIIGAQSKFCEMWTLEALNSACQAGLDGVSQIPVMRWEHEPYYDASPASWRTGKTWTRHMSFVDGLDEFDNKFFLIAPAEAGFMDPSQRQVLECGFECMNDAGLSKKQLMDSDTGFLLATTVPEFMFATGNLGTGDLATIANRIAFCLGMKGTNMSVDVDHASPLVCVNLAQRELGHGIENICCMGIYFNFTPEAWPKFMQAGFHSPSGRCLAFGDDANGYGRCDGCGSVFLQKEAFYKEEKVKKNLRDAHGIVSGSKSRSQGTCASITSPHGPCLQRIIAETLYDSKVSPLDVDAIECDAKGRMLDDCVEAASMLQVCRPYSQDNDEPLSLISLKTSLSNAWFAAGMGGLLKQLQAGKSGSSAPLVHLRILNPYLSAEAEDRTLQFSTELLESRAKTSILGVMACGWGGTNAYCQLWVQKLQQTNKTDYLDEARETAKQLAYWPGGSSRIDKDKSEDCYYILGSWSGGMPEMMEPEGNGTYGYTMTLGCLGWETFQFCIGDDKKKILHPGESSSTASKIQGPTQERYAGSWIVDGRSWSVEESLEDGSSQWISYEGADAAPPGTKYRVTLVMSEKGGYASWKILKDSPAAALSERENELIKGKFYVTSTHQGPWNFVPMQEDKSRADVWYAEVVLDRLSNKFMICRNRDWKQAFYPKSYSASHGPGKCCGPDADRGNQAFEVVGVRGDVIRIELCWNPSAGLDDENVPDVSWGHIDRQSVSKEHGADTELMKAALKKKAWERIWTAKEKKTPKVKRKVAARMDHVTLGSKEDGEEGIWTSGWPEHMVLGEDAGEGIE